MTTEPNLFEGPPGATPLTEDDISGLIPNWIATRQELDEAEQANIERAVLWLARGRGRPKTPLDALNSTYVNGLHRRMFSDVWSWAGTHRKSLTNIGVEPHRIVPDLKQTLDDATYWWQHDTFPAEEAAVRIHHRLVAIHPYPNGNGRHARLFADHLLELSGHPRLSWGATHSDTINQPGQHRTAYLTALRAADGGDIAPLLNFARN